MWIKPERRQNVFEDSTHNVADSNYSYLKELN